MKEIIQRLTADLYVSTTKRSTGDMLVWADDETVEEFIERVKEWIETNTEND